MRYAIRCVRDANWFASSINPVHGGARWVEGIECAQTWATPEEALGLVKQWGLVVAVPAEVCREVRG